MCVTYRVMNLALYFWCYVIWSGAFEVFLTHRLQMFLQASAANSENGKKRRKH